MHGKIALKNGVNRLKNTRRVYTKLDWIGEEGCWELIRDIPLIIDTNFFFRLMAEIVTRRWERTETDLSGNVYGPDVEYCAVYCYPLPVVLK